MSHQGTFEPTGTGPQNSPASDVIRMEVTMFETCSMKRLIFALIAAAALAASFPAHAAVKTIVLVHGAFADGSG